MINVIIPMYKSRNTISKTLASLAAQTAPFFFVTLVQDCDGEDYSDIIEQYENLRLNITLLQNEVNMGPGLSRQRALDISGQCDYVMFLDSDDALLPRALEIMHKEARRLGVDILASAFYAERNDKTVELMEPDTTSATWVHGKLYRTKYLQDNDICFLDNMRTSEDSYFNFVAYNCTNNKAYIKEPTHIWRANSESITRKKDGTPFFMKTALDYIASQALGLEKIKQIKGEISPTIMGCALAFIYNYSIRYIYETNYSYEDFVDELYEKFNFQYIYENFKITNDFIAAAASKIEVGAPDTKGKWFFFEYTFENFLYNLGVTI